MDHARVKLKMLIDPDMRKKGIYPSVICTKTRGHKETFVFEIVQPGERCACARAVQANVGATRTREKNIIRHVHTLSFATLSNAFRLASASVGEVPIESMSTRSTETEVHAREMVGKEINGSVVVLGIGLGRARRCGAWC